MSSWAILNPTIPETTAACNLTTSAIPVRNSVWLPLLTVIAQVITALDNIRAHYQRSVLDQHVPFLRRIVDRQIYNLPYRVNCREYVAFLDGNPDHAVQRFDSIRGVDVPWRITEERIEAFPVGTPAFADVRVPVVPDFCERIQSILCLLPTFIRLHCPKSLITTVRRHAGSFKYFSDRKVADHVSHPSCNAPRPVSVQPDKKPRSSGELPTRWHA